eukprot:1712142-Prymnesium_polylepis.1
MPLEPLARELRFATGARLAAGGLAPGDLAVAAPPLELLRGAHAARPHAGRRPLPADARALLARARAAQADRRHRGPGAGLADELARAPRGLARHRVAAVVAAGGALALGSSRALPGTRSQHAAAMGNAGAWPHALRSHRSQGVGGLAHSAPMDIFQQLTNDLHPEGRYLFLNAIANQLRYPNNHTHYFSCVLLYLFFESHDEA